MILSDIRDRVYYRLGRTGDTVLNSEILDALNMVQRENQYLINFDVLRTSANLTVVASTQSYNLASNFNKMYMIWESNSYRHELMRITPEEYKLYLSDVDTTTGTPYYYDIYDSAVSSGTYLKKISLFPVPSADATTPYHYFKTLSALTEDSDENILMELYPDLYIEGASYYIYRDIIYRDMPEKIAFRQAQYQKQVEIVKIAQRQPGRIDKVSPKRYIQGKVRRLFQNQYTGYTS